MCIYWMVGRRSVVFLEDDGGGGEVKSIVLENIMVKDFR